MCPFCRRVCVCSGCREAKRARPSTIEEELPANKKRKTDSITINLADAHISGSGEAAGDDGKALEVEMQNTEASTPILDFKFYPTTSHPLMKTTSDAEETSTPASVQEGETVEKRRRRKKSKSVCVFLGKGRKRGRGRGRGRGGTSVRRSEAEQLDEESEKSEEIEDEERSGIVEETSAESSNTPSLPLNFTSSESTFDRCDGDGMREGEGEREEESLQIEDLDATLPREDIDVEEREGGEGGEGENPSDVLLLDTLPYLFDEGEGQLHPQNKRGSSKNYTKARDTPTPTLRTRNRSHSKSDTTTTTATNTTTSSSSTLATSATTNSSNLMPQQRAGRRTSKNSKTNTRTKTKTKTKTYSLSPEGSDKGSHLFNFGS